MQISGLLPRCPLPSSVRAARDSDPPAPPAARHRLATSAETSSDGDRFAVRSGDGYPHGDRSPRSRAAGGPPDLVCRGDIPPVAIRPDLATIAFNDARAARRTRRTARRVGARWSSTLSTRRPDRHLLRGARFFPRTSTEAHRIAGPPIMARLTRAITSRVSARATSRSDIEHGTRPTCSTARAGASVVPHGCVAQLPPSPIAERSTTSPHAARETTTVGRDGYPAVTADVVDCLFVVGLAQPHARPRALEVPAERSHRRGRFHRGRALPEPLGSGDSPAISAYGKATPSRTGLAPTSAATRTPPISTSGDAEVLRLINEATVACPCGRGGARAVRGRPTSPSRRCVPGSGGIRPAPASRAFGRDRRAALPPRSARRRTVCAHSPVVTRRCGGG